MGKATEATQGYFNIDELIDEFPNARYYFILSGRSTGKTYSCIERSIRESYEGKGIFAYVRRYKDSISQGQLQDLLSPHNKYLEELSGGQYNHIGYWRNRWYMEYVDPETGERKHRNTAKPLGISCAISTWETSKGPDVGEAYNGFKNIIFDEALSKGGLYLKDEFSKFKNVISSLIRDRAEQDTKIYLLANPVSKWSSEYFDNLGITPKMLDEQGKTTLITYPESNLQTVFTYLSNAMLQNDKQQGVYDTYFAFSNSKMKSLSITEGIWELDDAQHLPSDIYNESENKLTTYICFASKIYALEVLKHTPTGIYYMFYRPAKEVKKGCYYYTLAPEINKFNICEPAGEHPVNKVISWIYDLGQVYYSDNTTADAIHGFYNAGMQIKR